MAYPLYCARRPLLSAALVLSQLSEAPIKNEHAAVYLMGVFSNTIQGIEGGILLGLAHGFVSSGLFICAGGEGGSGE